MSETLTDAQAAARLRALGAVRHAARENTRGRHIYWSGATKRWVAVDRTGAGQVRLTYTTTCPCGG